MPINVAEALDSDTAQIIKVERKAGGERINGVWVPGAASTFMAMASAQPATPDELQNLPEGQRDKSIFKFISNKPIYTARDRQQGEADIIIFKGIRWRVISGADWDSYGHTTVLAAKE
jgi:hypothetical protein